MDSAAEHLDVHGGDCPRYRVRMLPRACSLRQQAHPIGCAKCPAPLAPAATERPHIEPRRHRAPTKRKEQSMSKRGTCVACDKGPTTLPARGLCNSCYREWQATGHASVTESAGGPVDGIEQLAQASDPIHQASGIDSPHWGEVVGPPMDTPAARIRAECDALADFLIAKNAAYGNSALAPLRLFSRADPVEGLRVRIDDKLSRLAQSAEYPGDDTVLDLLGYLVLLRVATRSEPVPHV